MRLSRWGGLIIQRLSNTAQAINAGYINLLREQMKVSFEGWDIASATRMKRARIVHVIGGTLCFLDKLNSTILAQSKSSPESRGDSDVIKWDLSSFRIAVLKSFNQRHSRRVWSQR